MQEKIVRLDIIDNDDYYRQPMDTFYLINPDESKLERLREMVENRFRDDEDGKDNPFFSNYGAIYDYISENFNTLDIETFEIEW